MNHDIYGKQVQKVVKEVLECLRGHQGYSSSEDQKKVPAEGKEVLGPGEIVTLTAGLSEASLSICL